MIAMNEDTFLAKQGLAFPTSGYCLDKLRGNRQLKTTRGQKRYQMECEKAEKEYQEKRDTARAEYKRLVDAGEIRPLTPLEQRIKVANGHPDNAATQAARRLLAKKGIDWKTGVPIKEVTT